MYYIILYYIMYAYVCVCLQLATAFLIRASGTGGIHYTKG